MKQTFSTLFWMLIIATYFSSCTVEKRVHQDGYHISWKYRHSTPSELTQTNEISSAAELVVPSTPEIPQPNVHLAETISANSNEDIEVITTPKKYYSIRNTGDTIIPNQSKTQEEYFSNNYTAPSRPSELQDTQLANWALGLGIASLSAPVWGALLFLLMIGIYGSASASAGIWTALLVAFLAGSALFIAIEVLAITFAVRFLRMHAKDPNYRKYRSRAITGLILAGIYPALMVINIILALVLAI